MIFSKKYDFNIIYALDQPYIAVNDLLTCILDVSRNETFEFFMGEVYYKILEQNILSQSYYWHTLNSHWKSE